MNPYDTPIDVEPEPEYKFVWVTPPSVWRIILGVWIGTFLGLLTFILFSVFVTSFYG